MARDTGIDISILASVLGARPTLTEKEIQERLSQITSLPEATRFWQSLCKGSPSLKRVRNRHLELLREAINNAVSAKDWGEVARYAGPQKQHLEHAIQMLDQIFIPKLEKAGTDFKKLLAAYSEFNYPGSKMQKYRQELIRRMALHYTLEPVVDA